MKLNFRLEDIRYANLLYRDSNGNPCMDSIIIKDLKDNILANCKASKRLQLQSKQNVTLSIVCSDGLYILKTKVKSVEQDEPYIFIVFEQAESIEHHQKREYFRVPAMYECMVYARVDKELQDIKVKTFDISANGICLFIPDNVQYQNINELTINIENNFIKIKVKYIRAVKLEKGSKVSYYFDYISESDRNFISQVCIKKQIEERRNLLR